MIAIAIIALNPASSAPIQVARGEVLPDAAESALPTPVPPPSMTPFPTPRPLVAVAGSLVDTAVSFYGPWVLPETVDEQWPSVSAWNALTTTSSFAWFTNPRVDDDGVRDREGGGSQSAASEPDSDAGDGGWADRGAGVGATAGTIGPGPGPTAAPSQNLLPVPPNPIIKPSAAPPVIATPRPTPRPVATLPPTPRPVATLPPTPRPVATPPPVVTPPPVPSLGLPTLAPLPTPSVPPLLP